MSVLNIYRGIQGSGKSTLAEERAAQDGGRLVGRDRIRALLGVRGLGTAKQEKEVTEIQGRLIVEGLRSGQSVHVDDMNLKNKYVARLLGLAQSVETEDRKVGIRVLDLTNVPPETCVLRDAQRSPGNGHIGAKMIWDNYRRFVKGRPYPLPMPEKPELDPRMTPAVPYIPDMTKPKAIIIDLDGTTALKHPSRGYHDYDERVALDYPNQNVIRVIQPMLLSGYVPIFVSGRKGNPTCRQATNNWIRKNITAGTFYLWMREPHDNRPDWIVKNELFDQGIRDHFNVIAVFDDRQQVVDRWRELGLTVCQVAKWSE